MSFRTDSILSLVNSFIECVCVSRIFTIYTKRKITVRLFEAVWSSLLVRISGNGFFFISFWWISLNERIISVLELTPLFPISIQQSLFHYFRFIDSIFVESFVLCLQIFHRCKKKMKQTHAEKDRNSIFQVNLQLDSIESQLERCTINSHADFHLFLLVYRKHRRMYILSHIAEWLNKGNGVIVFFKRFHFSLRSFVAHIWHCQWLTFDSFYSYSFAQGSYV